jgi:hypothetical protein
MATPDDDPLRKALELLVYAPAGLLIEAKRLYPAVVETGRTKVDNDVKVARFIGRGDRRRRVTPDASRRLDYRS